MTFVLGLPWTAWLLLLASVGLGLTIVVFFYWIRHRTRSHDDD